MAALGSIWRGASFKGFYSMILEVQAGHDSEK